ncbi:urea amidolyase associated protein UAAP1 [Marinospirillum sp.]|uniref:urea amidolyase associated protein UAAP1 n=1 Tax=Marinospirillum sp. TaxID=2183934 RepID=UPI00286FEF7D|nr:urea amidolyase associated protein UAAP1 [Marinospirillum sp.]MDR9469403.1 urea carboxylase-associated family protein [Marinospirillum sp.]
MLESIEYTTEISPGGHWSLRMARGTCLRLTDRQGGANMGMLFYNPENLLERYNAPDTLKCQHTFRLTRGHCLYSDMGRIFASIIEDTTSGHDTVSGNTSAALTEKRWGQRNYQKDRNAWHQNGQDAFLVELEKYGLGLKDLASNLNLFSLVRTDEEGRMQLAQETWQPGAQVTLRFEMDTLVLLHTCPHPLDTRESYPARPVKLELGLAEPVREDDYNRNFRPENQRGFQNNALYYLGR